jgi:hypothetical protein
MLLDKYCPEFDFTEVHTIRIKGEPETVFRSLNEVTWSELSYVVHILFSLRALPEKLAGRKDKAFNSQDPMMSGMYNNGFTLVDEEPPYEVVFGRIVPGNIGRVWQKSSGLDVPVKNSEEFISFKNPDYLKVVANFRVIESLKPGYVIVSTESRTKALSPESRHKFAPYWRIIRPFSGLIRRMMLGAVKRRAARETIKSATREQASRV